MGRGPTKDHYQIMNENFVEGSLTCLSPAVIERRITTEFPLVLNIEPTNACNAKCYYCPNGDVVKNQGIGFLDINDYKGIIDQIKSHKLIMLNFHKDGEPLLHKKLPDMVEYAKEKDAAEVIHLNTNGILINTKVGRGIIEREIDDITISIDAANKNTYLQLKGINGFDKLEESIEKIVDYRDKINSNTKIRVKIMEFDEIGQEEIDLFIEKWSGIADEVQVTGIHNWSGAFKSIEVTDEQSANERYPCALLWYMLAINSNGKVSTCNVDWNYSGVVGDIHNQSIKEIWNCVSIKNIRRAQLNEKWDCPQVCRECVVWVSVGDMKEYLETRVEFL